VTPIKNRRFSPKRKNMVDSPSKDASFIQAQGKKGKQKLIKLNDMEEEEPSGQDSEAVGSQD
jgi:hypothetical protein